MRHHGPDYPDIHAKVLMDDPIAETNDPSPRDFGMASFELLGDSCGCLAYDLEVSDYGINSAGITRKRLEVHFTDIRRDPLH